MKLGNNKINKKSNPFVLFNEWYEEAKRKEIKNPNAMALSTIDSFNRPRTRMVLMKEINKKGIVFYTNSESYKGKQIDKNKNVSLCFYWKSLGKQIIIQGKINKINETESDQYFHSRDRKSKIGAWASDQSKILKKRSILEKRYNDFFKKFSGKEVSRPNYWNGYCVEPRTFEFWLERQNRLHERVEYKLNKAKWSRRFLYP
jgi:pyridoxamine 5'-phosphate oxidase|tara:strand:- start:1669 stop:2274 length:606 start_codon:yes stop_codon:yes gene_type:complete